MEGSSSDSERSHKMDLLLSCLWILLEIDSYYGVWCIRDLFRIRICLELLGYYLQFYCQLLYCCVLICDQSQVVQNQCLSFLVIKFVLPIYMFLLYFNYMHLNNILVYFFMPPYVGSTLIILPKQSYESQYWIQFPTRALIIKDVDQTPTLSCS